tara:strand:+ start:1461 stop:1589 length:129 start_codon:yes stop_codon:yes gene_type:complete
MDYLLSKSPNIFDILLEAIFVPECVQKPDRLQDEKLEKSKEW